MVEKLDNIIHYNGVNKERRNEIYNKVEKYTKCGARGGVPEAGQ